MVTRKVGSGRSPVSRRSGKAVMKITGTEWELRMSLTASTLLYGVLVAAFLWLMLVPFYAMSGVDLGVGRLHGLGPAPLTAALWGAGIGAAGAMIEFCDAAED